MIQSVNKAMEIFNLVSIEGHLSLKALSSQIGMPKSTISRLAQTLETCGYLHRHKKGGDYYISNKLLRAGYDVLEGSAIRDCIDRVLNNLSNITNETINLTVLDDAGVLFIHKIDSHNIHNGIKVGSKAPLHCTASGKAILASLSREEANNVLDKCLPLEQYTKNTIVDVNVLWLEIGNYQDRGYFIAKEEIADGVHSIGAPILEFPGRDAAALSIAWPTNRSRPEQFEEWGKLLNEACQEISLKLKDN